MYWNSYFASGSAPLVNLEVSLSSTLLNHCFTPFVQRNQRKIQAKVSLLKCILYNSSVLKILQCVFPDESLFLFILTTVVLLQFCSPPSRDKREWAEVMYPGAHYFNLEDGLIDFNRIYLQESK